MKEKGFPLIESLMFDEHDMVKRAATECMCNMVLCEEVTMLLDFTCSLVNCDSVGKCRQCRQAFRFQKGNSWKLVYWHSNKFSLLLLQGIFFTITAEIHASSLAKFYGQYADRHMNLKFVPHVSEREREILQSVIVKNKLMSAFNASVLLLTMNFVITLSN